MFDILSAIGQPIGESESISYILARLPSEYYSLITSVNTRLEPMALDELFAHLLHHEMRLEQLAIVTEVNLPSSNFVTYNSYNSSRGQTSSNHQSHGCSFGNRGGRGHKCSHINSNLFSFGSTTTPPFCQICQKARHTATKCWHRFDQDFQTPSAPQACHTTTQPLSNQTWYSDTGATHHITSNLQNLNIHTEDYSGQDQVLVGNGKGLKFIISANP